MRERRRKQLGLLGGVRKNARDQKGRLPEEWRDHQKVSERAGRRSGSWGEGSTENLSAQTERSLLRSVAKKAARRAVDFFGRRTGAVPMRQSCIRSVESGEGKERGSVRSARGGGAENP